MARIRPIPQLRPMTEDERRMAEVLGRCRILPGSPEKRFAGAMATLAAQHEPLITVRQAEWLRVLVHRYRRQIPADVVALAQAQEGGE